MLDLHGWLYRRTDGSCRADALDLDGFIDVFRSEYTKLLASSFDLPAIIVDFPFASTCYTNGPFLYVVFLTVINLYPLLVFFCIFFYIRDVSFVCLYVLHMQLSCGIKSILTYLLTVYLITVFSAHKLYSLNCLFSFSVVIFNRN